MRLELCDAQKGDVGMCTRPGWNVSDARDGGEWAGENDSLAGRGSPVEVVFWTLG